MAVGEKSRHPARCVVWTAAGRPVPPSLAGALGARGVSIVHAGNAHTAMAELCLAQRAGERAGLILCGPVDAGRVLDAAERFAPRAVVWVYEEGANPPLRPLVQRARPEPEPAPQAPAPGPVAGRNGAGVLRLVREAGLKASNGRADASEAVTARDVLDDAELEMLLAGERAMEDPR